MNQGLQCRAYLPFEANSATLGYCLLHTVPEGDAGLILAAKRFARGLSLIVGLFASLFPGEKKTYKQITQRPPTMTAEMSMA